MGVAAAVAGMEWGECIVPSAAVPAPLVADVRRAIGVVPGWVSRLAPCPWLVQATIQISGRPIAHAPWDLCDLVSVVVAQDNSCRYCYGATRALLKILGYPDEYIDRLVQDFHGAELPAQRAALDFARRVSRANPRPGRLEFEQVVEAGFSRLAVSEIVAVAAEASFFNRVATLLALPPESVESVVDRRLFALVRPLVAWWIRAKPRPPQPAPEANPEPFARLVAALDGSPVAAVVRRVVDDAWASPVLPRRTKSLVLAVVARALACPYSEAQARGMLEPEGLSAAEVDPILANLTSSRLDRLEARLVPFARETVRYQARVVQRRLREVCEGCTVEETLEAVGIVALANGLCRLSVVLDA